MVFVDFFSIEVIMQLQINGIDLDIISVGGLYTCVQFPQYKIAMDLGIAPRSSFNKSHIFFTHAHADHIAGVTRHCSSRKLLGLPPPTYVIGQEDAENFVNFMQSAGKLFRSDMLYNLEVVEPKQILQIHKQLSVQSYRSIHTMPCQGYIIQESRTKLKQEFLSLSGRELQQLRESGVELSETIHMPIVSYTGDTTIDTFHREKILQRLQVLVTEVTFFDDSVSPKEAKRRGHMHIDDLAHQDLFPQPAIVLMHSSSRFSKEEITHICQKKLSQEMLKRIHIVPNNLPLENF
jgi:ribonuclease Z